MDTSGFYAVVNGEIQAAPNFVEGPDVSLQRANKDSYSYPVGGWYWFDSYALALATLTMNPRHITRLAFRNRFTKAEKVTLEMAALDNPSSTMTARQQAAAVRVSLADQFNATYIDLDRADTRAGVQDLETAGLLAAGRALQILDTATTATELYQG